MTQDGRLTIAIKAAARRLRISSELEREYADDPEQLLAAIIDQSEARFIMVREFRKELAVVANQIERMRTRRTQVGRTQVAGRV